MRTKTVNTKLFSPLLLAQINFNGILRVSAIVSLFLIYLLFSSRAFAASHEASATGPSSIMPKTGSVLVKNKIQSNNIPVGLDSTIALSAAHTQQKIQVLKNALRTMKFVEFSMSPQYLPFRGVAPILAAFIGKSLAQKSNSSTGFGLFFFGFLFLLIPKTAKSRYRMRRGRFEEERQTKITSLSPPGILQKLSWELFFFVLKPSHQEGRFSAVWRREKDMLSSLFFVQNLHLSNATNKRYFSLTLKLKEQPMHRLTIT